MRSLVFSNRFKFFMQKLFRLLLLMKVQERLRLHLSYLPDLLIINPITFDSLGGAEHLIVT
jgi:hypothetical protein